MTLVTLGELLDAGVHFGHLKRKWNPALMIHSMMKKKHEDL